MVRAIIGVARELDIDVIAQGVQTEAQRELLTRTPSTTKVQGFTTVRQLQQSRRQRCCVKGLSNHASVKFPETRRRCRLRRIPAPCRAGDHRTRRRPFRGGPPRQRARQKAYASGTRRLVRRRDWRRTCGWQEVSHMTMGRIGGDHVGRASPALEQGGEGSACRCAGRAGRRGDRDRSGPCHANGSASVRRVRWRMTISFARHQFRLRSSGTPFGCMCVSRSAIATSKICSRSAVWMSPTKRCGDGF